MSGSSYTLVHPRDGGAQTVDDLLDPILCGLLAAQVAWLGTHDRAALRRELIAILAACG